MVRYCPHHGRQTRAGAKFCPACGITLRRRRKSPGKWAIALLLLGAAIWLGFLQSGGKRYTAAAAKRAIAERANAAANKTRRSPLAGPDGPGSPLLTRAGESKPVAKIKIRHYDRPRPTDTFADVFLDPAGSHYAVVPVAQEKVTVVYLGHDWTLERLSAHGEHSVGHKLDKSARTLEIWGRNNAGNSALVFLKRR